MSLPAFWTKVANWVIHADAFGFHWAWPHHLKHTEIDTVIGRLFTDDFVFAGHEFVV